MWEDSGFGTVPVDWTGAREARADLEASLGAGERVEQPVRLVLPLLAEALRLRLDVAKGHFTSSVAGHAFLAFLVAVVLLGVIVMGMNAALVRLRVLPIRPDQGA